jgi:hypothetical protein
LQYLGGYGVRLHGFSDSDWVSSDTDQKSTSGCCFSLGSSNNFLVQQEADFSSTEFSRRDFRLILVEEKYMEANLASCEAIWLHKLLT